MTETSGKKGPADRRAHLRPPRTYPMLGRYQVQSHSMPKSETNPRPRTKLKLGRYEVHVPETSMRAQTLGPYGVQRRRTLPPAQSVPMLGSYEAHQRSVLYHQGMPMLGPYAVRQGRTLYQTLPMPRSLELQPGHTLHQQTPMLGSYDIHPGQHLQYQTLPSQMLGSYALCPPAGNGMPYAPMRDNRRRFGRIPHQGRKRTSNHNRRRCSANRRILNPNTHHQKPFDEAPQKPNNSPFNYASNSISVPSKVDPTHDANINEIKENMPPKASTPPPVPEPSSESEMAMSDVLDIDILGPWTEEDERLYRSDLIPL